MFKKGLGMVTVAGPSARTGSTPTPTPIPIEEWAQIEKDRESITVHESLHGKSYTWSLRPIEPRIKNKNRGPPQAIYDVISVLLIIPRSSNV
jgi:hypothetical protein